MSPEELLPREITGCAVLDYSGKKLRVGRRGDISVAVSTIRSFINYGEVKPPTENLDFWEWFKDAAKYVICAGKTEGEETVKYYTIIAAPRDGRAVIIREECLYVGGCKIDGIYLIDENGVREQKSLEIHPKIASLLLDLIAAYPDIQVEPDEIEEMNPEELGDEVGETLLVLRNLVERQARPA